MKNGRGPFTHKKGGKNKKKEKIKRGKRGKTRKNMASSKILIHGLASLKGSPQSEKEKERALRSDDPAVWSWSPASYQ